MIVSGIRADRVIAAKLFSLVCLIVVSFLSYEETVSLTNKMAANGGREPISVTARVGARGDINEAFRGVEEAKWAILIKSRRYRVA